MTVKISDFYETDARLIKVTDADVAAIGDKQAENADRFNGNPGDFAGDVDRSRADEIKTRKQADIAEVVAAKWLDNVTDSGVDRVPCLESDIENAPVDVVLNNGTTIDVKSRQLAGDLPACDLLGVAEKVDRNDQIDYYLSVAVGRDVDYIAVQGGHNRKQFRACPVVNLVGNTYSYMMTGLLENNTQMMEPDSFIDAVDN